MLFRINKPENALPCADMPKDAVFPPQRMVFPWEWSVPRSWRDLRGDIRGDGAGRDQDWNVLDMDLLRFRIVFRRRLVRCLPERIVDGIVGGQVADAVFPAGRVRGTRREVRPGGDMAVHEGDRAFAGMPEIGIAALAGGRIVQIRGRRGAAVAPGEETCGIGKEDQPRRHFHVLDAADAVVRRLSGRLAEGKQIVHAVSGVTGGPGEVGVEGGFRHRTLEDASAGGAGIRYDAGEDARPAVVARGLPAGEVRVPGGTEDPVARVGVEKMHQRDFPDVAEAEGQAGAVPRRRQRRQKHPGQNHDDRDHDQKLDQGEPVTHGGAGE